MLLLTLLSIGLAILGSLGIYYSLGFWVICSLLSALVVYQQQENENHGFVTKIEGAIRAANLRLNLIGAAIGASTYLAIFFIDTFFLGLHRNSYLSSQNICSCLLFTMLFGICGFAVAVTVQNLRQTGKEDQQMG